MELPAVTVAIDSDASLNLGDAIADNLELWWNERKVLYPHIRNLMIDLDNGPEVASRRTQFMKR